MVQSTNCIIILVPIPSLPKPSFLTVLISCKHSCRFSPLRNTGYPMRKRASTSETVPSWNAKGNCLSRSTILHRCYTKRNFQSKSHLQKRDMLLTFTTTPLLHSPLLTMHSQILPLPHFTSLKMSIPITKFLHKIPSTIAGKKTCSNLPKS